MQRSCRWATEDGGGLEHFAIRHKDGGIFAQGVVIGPGSGALYAGELFGCSYAIRCDAHWRARQVEVWVAGGAHLVLRADGEGRWSGPQGDPLPGLDGCIDVDLGCTPFTNTLPIRRLGEALYQRQELIVVYITLPEASVMPSRQAYTALGGGRYLFESLSDRFEAEIDTDADGLLLHYPGLFRRAGS
jgi:hypothetical protein